ncbi:uncharacterized protein YuzE [Microbacterium testaceum]|uniref:DUF2283 domain-containing protein n=1 Tax=Microbacterium TaxID=33882 RepID=UPI002789EB13|nr:MULTISPECIES: DUF2283 domain-containing protein [Microbacterium]MDQ1111909.1 uncharacterized protein YuzE [Microbacterium testaceum]MDR6097554.1 uncharacterized protein YuzE [Microbacterium sp. SORGH_AS_0454]
MQVTYDAEADAAYITIADDIAEGAATQQLHSIATPGGVGEIILDFDDDNRLIGLEVLNARLVLPENVIRTAKDPA